MKNVIAAINMTLDGFCDHTAIPANDELHQHYADLLSNADTVLYGRVTYQLMEYWQTLVKNPSGEKSMDDFAMAIDKVPKIVFSRTLKNVAWESAKLANRAIEEEVSELKQSRSCGSEDIFVGSRSLIIQSIANNLTDYIKVNPRPTFELIDNWKSIDNEHTQWIINYATRKLK